MYSESLSKRKSPEVCPVTWRIMSGIWFKASDVPSWPGTVTAGHVPAVKINSKNTQNVKRVNCLTYILPFYVLPGFSGKNFTPETGFAQLGLAGES